MSNSQHNTDTQLSASSQRKIEMLTSLQQDLASDTTIRIVARRGGFIQTAIIVRYDGQEWLIGEHNGRRCSKWQPLTEPATMSQQARKMLDNVNEQTLRQAVSDYRRHH